MKKVKVATVWLDGCSGCHMSLLDMDAAIISLAQKIDMFTGRWWTRRSFPRTWMSPWSKARSVHRTTSNKLQKIRQRTHLLISLGDCAVTGNVPAMRNSIPVNKLLQRIYVEGAHEGKVGPDDGVPAAVEAGAARCGSL